MTNPDGGAAFPQEVMALDWLARNTACELVYHYGEEGDEPDEWRVYRVTGNRNDREWSVIGRGKTPLQALLSARGDPK